MKHAVENIVAGTATLLPPRKGHVTGHRQTPVDAPVGANVVMKQV